MVISKLVTLLYYLTNIKGVRQPIDKLEFHVY